MPANVQPGQTVTITLTTSPTNQAAAKTLRRLFVRDPERRRQNTAQKQMLQRAVRFRRRGGRPWGIRPTIPCRVPKKGESCKLLVTADVMRDLGKLHRFVDIKSA